MAKPRRSPARGSRDPDAKVRVEFDYREASLLVVAANVLFGAMPDEETQRSLTGLLDKLYKAEPQLKSDARRIEKEMRGFLTDEAGGLDDEEEEGELAPLKGGNLLPVLMAAMEQGRVLPLLRRDGVLDLLPTGAGQIGDVAIAIGWSAAHGDYTLVRMDEVIGIGLDNPQARPVATDPAVATLARLCPKPPARGGLL